MAAIKALEQWCRAHCEGYRDVAITNMTTSFRSGLAFCALIHKYRPDLIDYDSLRKDDVFGNNKLAFQVAEEKLGIPALLDAEDMVALRVPDRLSILTYVSQYYNYFNGRPPMGGVKRPAEGSREEPSEKKNLPAVAKNLVSKTTTENRLPSSFIAQTSPKSDKVAAENGVLADNANKNGTLNSKCVACKSHVHLVQRHFVEGKLYHRSCFKCSECSSVLHAGGYKSGTDPDTFICKAHQNSCRRSSSECEIKFGAAISARRLKSGGRPEPTPRPSSVLLAPVDIVVKPVNPTPPPEPWTPSAQKTQSARQRFFQAAVPEVATRDGKPSELSVSGSHDDDDKSRARASVGKKVAEENCNNNNKRPFTIRSAERRFGDQPSYANSPGLRTDKHGESPARNSAGHPSTNQTQTKEWPMESPCLEAINKHSTRPAVVHSTAKDLPLADPVFERQSNPRPLKPALGRKEGEAETFTERPEPGFSSTAFGATGPPSAPSPPVSSTPFSPGHLREDSLQKPQPSSGNLSFKHGSQLSVKSPPRQPAVESIKTSRTAPANHGNPPGAKKGKYLSPTNASRTEMRSPSVTAKVKSYHIPVEQIEKELGDIETKLARLEKEGVELEKKLRSCEEEGEGDILMDPLMVDWFNLIRKKQMYIRKESELVYIARTQELEEQQPSVEGELRRLLEKPDELKSREERQQEKKLMQRLVEIVNGRNAIVEGLDEDRLREVEEDQQLNEMMKNLGVKKAEHKRKSSISKLFRRRSKRRVE